MGNVVNNANFQITKKTSRVTTFAEVANFTEVANITEVANFTHFFETFKKQFFRLTRDIAQA